MIIKRYIRLLLITTCFALSLPALFASGGDGAAKKTVMVITINGAINPVSAEYVINSIEKAREKPGVEALVIQMDTPGGLDTAMRQIIKEMQSSPVPVIVYVSPSGSRAASAGAFITMAAHVAAMAPGTNIGAASPVNMGGGGMDKTMKKKVTNDAAAYMRSIAEAHGRNADLGEKFVRKGTSIPESEALKENVVDMVVEDLPTLLKFADGRVVKTAAGEKKLATAGAEITRVEMTWRQRFFDAMANPNIAYILMMLGFYGLFFELSNPGSILPGVIGAICLILAFYSLQALPISFAGVLLIALAMILFMLEIWVTSYGVLSVGGIVALVIGSLMLIESPEEYMKISLAVVIPTAVFTAAFFAAIVGSGARAQFRKVKTGKEAMIGLTGVAETDISPDRTGRVIVEGELWTASALDGKISAGAPVEVVELSGLTVIVKPKRKEESDGEPPGPLQRAPSTP